jgi:hypothetical protein
MLEDQVFDQVFDICVINQHTPSLVRLLCKLVNIHNHYSHKSSNPVAQFETVGLKIFFKICIILLHDTWAFCMTLD